MNKDNLKAVALIYDGQSAPKVAAKGVGGIAQNIISKAKEHGIPLEQNEELTALLSQVRLGSEIPPTLYTAVAQLLAFIYYMNEKPFTPDKNKL